MEEKIINAKKVHKENLEKFVKTIKENKDLEVLPFMDAEGCGDDYGWYMGDFGSTEVDYVYFAEEKILIGEDDYREHLQEYTNMNDEEIEKAIEDERKKYIVLYINKHWFLIASSRELGEVMKN